jgi:hypothetical protein
VAIASAQMVFSGARRPGKVEGEPQAARMLFAESPLSEDELVAVDEAERLVEGSARSRRENYIGERAVSDDGLNRAATTYPAGK